MLNVDVGFADPFTEKPGRAAAAYVYAKQQRYPAWRNPTEDLVPFIIERFGYPSKKAAKFLRQFAPTDPRARSLELRRAYRELSCLTQQRIAVLLRSTEDNRKPYKAAFVNVYIC